MKRFPGMLLAFIALGAAPAAAQDAASPVGPGNVLQVLTGLALVLFLVLGVAWLLRRIGQVPGLSTHAIRTVGAAAVGSRERVVLLEVAGTWILIGVAPGHVCQLATMPKGELAASVAQPGDPAAFSGLLKRILDRRHAA